MTTISEILSRRRKPALLIGNGINRHNSSANSGWDDLLATLAHTLDLGLGKSAREEISNTEFYDLLDLARPKEDRSNLQRRFGDLMTSWEPGSHHTSIVSWAQRHRTPIITVNFDENLSRSIDSGFYRLGEGFTDWYPWSSYFSDGAIEHPRKSFAIWHAHGIMRYPRSIRLGLTHYAGCVQRARSWVYRGADGLLAAAKHGGTSWRGQNTWLDVLFFSPLMIFGFGFNKDEIFLRWLFLERARAHKIRPTWKADTWFIDTPKNGALHRKPFFEGLGMKYVATSRFAEIYEDPIWAT